jgi:hypothetical protein
MYFNCSPKTQIMKIEFSMGNDAQVQVAFIMNRTEFLAMKKAFMWCDFSKMDDAQRQAIEQINRNISRIELPE